MHILLLSACGVKTHVMPCASHSFLLAMSLSLSLSVAHSNQFFSPYSILPNVFKYLLLQHLLRVVCFQFSSRRSQHLCFFSIQLLQGAIWLLQFWHFLRCIFFVVDSEQRASLETLKNADTQTPFCSTHCIFIFKRRKLFFIKNFTQCFFMPDATSHSFKYSLLVCVPPLIFISFAFVLVVHTLRSKWNSTSSIDSIQTGISKQIYRFYFHPNCGAQPKIYEFVCAFLASMYTKLYLDWYSNDIYRINDNFELTDRPKMRERVNGKRYTVFKVDRYSICTVVCACVFVFESSNLMENIKS